MNDISPRRKFRGAWIRKIRSKAAITRDKLLRPKRVLKILLPLLLGPIFALSIVCIITYSGYSAKISKEVSTLDDEFNIAVGIYSSNEPGNQIANTVKNIETLYKERKVTRAYLVVLSEDPANVQTYVYEEMLKEVIPPSNITVIKNYTEHFELCNKIYSEFGLHKFIITASRSLLLKSSFVCNAKGIYTQGYLPDNEFSGGASFFDLLQDIFDLISGK